MDDSEVGDAAAEEDVGGRAKKTKKGKRSKASNKSGSSLGRSGDRRETGDGTPMDGPPEDARRVAQTRHDSARFESIRRVENALRTYEIG